MWKLALGAVLALPLWTGFASAATVDVSITKTAFVPGNASLSTADTVKFTNNDTTAHQVVFKAATRRDVLADPVHPAARPERHLHFHLRRNVQLLRPRHAGPAGIADRLLARPADDAVALRATRRRDLRRARSR